MKKLLLLLFLVNNLFCNSQSRYDQYHALFVGGEGIFNNCYGGTLFFGMKKKHFEWRSAELTYLKSEKNWSMFGFSQTLRYLIIYKGRFQPYAGITPGIYFFSDGYTNGMSGRLGFGLSPNLGVDFYITKKMSIFGNAKYLVQSNAPMQFANEIGFNYYLH